VLRWHFVKANRLTAKELLSPRYIWMAAKETDEFRDRATTFIELEGTSLKAALDIARNYGAALESSLPFKPEHLFQDSANAFYALAAQRKIASYFNLQDSDAARRLQGWRAWIATHGPILTRLDVDATWDDAKATHGALAVYQASTARGGHAVALVGYTPTTFIVRNSWGTSDWGDNGFGYASLDYAKAAFNESYGVTL
jgi:hypothetical protein